ncbi:hypothetical protein AC579_4067 [Pseudocercospora musae]|uniref:C2H2-type domain-containing protein n=1 Tax=Pseudocercospora musae TaxID=113226 RepID=A0A139I8W0_9PEZI|nr:hypothetical protein AC579_4067 [Pseudocercospora musae]
MYWCCDTCDREFGSEQACNQHMNALGHGGEREGKRLFECHTCSFSSLHESDTDDHMDRYGHWQPQFDCEACSTSFWSNAQAISHMNTANHWRKHWCADCERGFQNANNLRQHLNGATHRAGSISCPFCKKPHTTASGVAHHIETASCPKARTLNRETVYKIINARDTTGLITNKQLTWRSEDNNDYVANEASWNGCAYECYLCHRRFASLDSLNQHLSSPLHKQKVYHCFGRMCGKQFSAIAQLFNHLESESCGAMRFGQVQQGAAAILSGRKMIAF